LLSFKHRFPFCQPSPRHILGSGNSGLAATVFYGLFCVFLISGIAIFKLQKWSYPLALGLQIFGLGKRRDQVLQPSTYSVATTDPDAFHLRIHSA
jgi:hypothetical protein